jgi:hypothetical protein
MYSIRLRTGEFLDVPVGLTLPYELNNQVFSTSSTEVLPGSFTFPVDLPASDLNRRLLNNPQLEANAYNFREYPDTSIYCHGVEIFRGTLKILSANRQKIKVTVVSAPLSKLKNVPLNELDLGGDRSVGDTATTLAFARSTAENPLDHDFCFFPVLNDRFLGGQDNEDYRRNMQNHFNVDTLQFEVGHGSPNFMPFVRADYVISRIFAGLEFGFQNLFAIDDERRKIYLYNNRSLWTAKGVLDPIDLRNHVPKTASTAWLRKFMSVFCLGLFTNVFRKTIRLIPLRDLLARPAQHDWTQYALDPAEISSAAGDIPVRVNYPDSDDEAFQYGRRNVRPPVLATFRHLEEIETSSFSGTAGYFYVTSRAAYYYYDPAEITSQRYRLIYTELGPAPVREGNPTLDIEMAPLFDYWHRSDVWIARPTNSPFGPMPMCRITGTTEYLPTGATESIRVESNIPERLMIYRGYLQDSMLRFYPLAVSTPYLSLPSPAIGKVSLRLQDEFGTYNQFWSLWHQVLTKGKPVSITLELPLSQLLAFSFEHKVTVRNIDYFVKRLLVTKALSGSRMLVEADLVSMI